jgi:NADH-ubiquinone oxidoreductase chain 6
MDKLLLLYETYTNGYFTLILNILALLAVLCGIFVIIINNPITSVLFLIGLFANISFYLMLLGLTFISLSYLIVYIGAVSILFLFILMLINIRVSELQSNNSNSISLSILISICLYYPLYQLIPNSLTTLSYFKNIFYTSIDQNNVYDTNDNIYFVTSKIWDGNLGETSHITTIGNIMYTNYNLWLILASLILLLAMVGAIVITIKQE